MCEKLKELPIEVAQQVEGLSKLEKCLGLYYGTINLPYEDAGYVEVEEFNCTSFMEVPDCLHLLDLTPEDWALALAWYSCYQRLHSNDSVRIGCDCGCGGDSLDWEWESEQGDLASARMDEIEKILGPATSFLD